MAEYIKKEVVCSLNEYFSVIISCMADAVTHLCKCVWWCSGSTDEHSSHTDTPQTEAL